MCIVIDANVWGCVFETNSALHNEYKPVYDWIVNGPGFVVYGGTQYNTELKKAKKYFGVFTELKKSLKAKIVNTYIVDQEENRVKRLINSSSCDDTHLIAIFRASGCRLLCSNDRRADFYIKNKKYYYKRQKRPLIYRNSSHKSLLNSRNIVRLRNVI